MTDSTPLTNRTQCPLDQLALAELWPCDVCKGTRVEVDPETQQERPCRVCGATGMLDYDPADTTEMGF